jgi:hypothetical protein
MLGRVLRWPRFARFGLIDQASDSVRRRALARQGVFHALAAGAMLDGVLVGKRHERPGTAQQRT